MDQKNEDISKSVSSIDTGAIFPPPGGQDLSRNAFVVSVYAFERDPSWRIGFFLRPKMSKFHEHFGKTLAVKLYLNFGGPAGGPGTWKGAWAPRTLPHDS